jgi:hypothetical protein
VSIFSRQTAISRVAHWPRLAVEPGGTLSAGVCGASVHGV